MEEYHQPLGIIIKIDKTNKEEHFMIMFTISNLWTKNLNHFYRYLLCKIKTLIFIKKKNKEVGMRTIAEFMKHNNMHTKMIEYHNLKCDTFYFRSVFNPHFLHLIHQLITLYNFQIHNILF